MPAAAHSHDSETRTRNLLILDDEASICQALKRLLRRDGYTIRTTTSADEALELVSALPIDVVVSDQRMPQCLGTEFLTQVRDIRPETVRIILSGYADVSDVASAMNAGAIHKFLTKPWDDGLLRADIREAFMRADAVRALAEDEFDDDTTGLPSLEYLKRIFQSARDRAAEQGSTVCVFFIKIEQFEEIRLGYGSDQANALLTAAAERLNPIFSGDASIARSGDGFVVIARALDPTERLDSFRDRLNALEDEEIPMADGLVVNPTFAVGCAFDDENAETLDVLLEHAQVAAQFRTSTVNVRARLFDPAVLESRRRELSVQQELLDAVRSEVLDVYYQPQIDSQTGHVSGLEALIRWAHPILGRISPNEFIPLAERNGKILEIGYQVLRSAVGAASAWRREGIWSGELSVNISPRQLSSRELLDQVDEVLSVHEFPPELLVLEITENLAVDSDDSVRERLTELRRRGITLAMDDFGTGHANLTNVVDLPVNKVKLDRSLLPVSHDDERGLHVFTNVVSFIDQLGYEIIAEGVETGEQLAIAHEAGCRYIQGYFFSPPLAERRIQKLLTNGISVTQSAESRRSA